MTTRTSMTLTDDRRLLEDRARALLDDVLPAEQYRATLYDLALMNLIDTVENHNEFQGNPEVAKQFNTRIVRSHYRTNVDVRRP